MKQVKLLFLFGLSLVSATAFSMNLGRFASRMGKLGAGFAGKAKTAAQIAKPGLRMMVKAVTPIGAACYGTALLCAGMVKDPDIAQQVLNSQSLITGIKTKKMADDRFAAFIRDCIGVSSSDEIQVFLFEGYTGDLDYAIKGGGLSCVDIFNSFDINAEVRFQHSIIVSPAVYAFWQSPKAFSCKQEYDLFVQTIRAIIKHENGHRIEHDWFNQALLRSAMVYAATESMITLVSMSKIAPKTVIGQVSLVLICCAFPIAFMRVVYLMNSRRIEHRADHYVEDEEERELLAKLFYHKAVKEGFRSDLSSWDHFEKNVSDLFTSAHPNLIERVKNVWGLENLAEYIVERDIALLDQYIKQHKESMSWSEKYNLKHNLEHKRANKEANKQEKLAMLEDSISIKKNIQGMAREAVTDILSSRWGRSEMKKKVAKDIVSILVLQKQLLALKSEEEQVKLCEEKFELPEHITQWSFSKYTEEGDLREATVAEKINWLCIIPAEEFVNLRCEKQKQIAQARAAQLGSGIGDFAWSKYWQEYRIALWNR